MSADLEPRLPQPLELALAPDAPIIEGLTLLLLTVRDDRWPHMAMLSMGEVVVRDERTLGVLLWPNSTSTRAIGAGGQGSLCAVLDGASWTLRLSFVEEATIRGEHGEFRRFAATVVGASVDRAPYADLTSGVTFRLKDRDAVLRRWAAMREILASPGEPIGASDD